MDDGLERGWWPGTWVVALNVDGSLERGRCKLAEGKGEERNHCSNSGNDKGKDKRTAWALAPVVNL